MSEDLIRRSDAIDALKNALCELGGDEWGDGELGVHADDIDAVIKGIPSADVIEPKHGEWKKVKNVHVWDVSGIETWGVKRKCTICDFRHTFIEDHGHYNFCPNCNADMRGADDE